MPGQSIPYSTIIPWSATNRHSAGEIISAPGADSASYLLDDLTSAPDVLISPNKVFALAYESAAIIRLRRTSDGAEADFTGAEIAAGDELTWVGAQTSFVRYIYDQSGNSKDLGQATAAYQGQYTDSSGNLITMTDGNPAPQQIPVGMAFPALGFTGSDGAAVFRFNGNSDNAWQLLYSGGPWLARATVAATGTPFKNVGSPTLLVDGVELSPSSRNQFYLETNNQDVTVRVTNIDWSNANWNVVIAYLTYYGNAKFSSVALYNSEPSSADLDLIVNSFEST